MAKSAPTPAAAATTAPKKRVFETVRRAQIWRPEEKNEQREGTFLSVQLVMGKPMGKNPASEFITFNFETDPAGTDTRGQQWSVSSAMLNGPMDLVPIGTYCKVTYTGWFQEGLMVNKSRNFLVESEHGVALLTPGSGHFSKKLEVVEATDDEPADPTTGAGADPTTVPGGNGAAMRTPPQDA